MIHDIEIEKALLGTLLLDSKAIEHCGSFPVENFYLESHRTIFSSIIALHALGNEVDGLTLSESLRRAGRLDSVGGMGYLSDLTTNTWRNSDVTPYLKILREKSSLRAVIGICDLISARAQQEEPSEDLLHELHSLALREQASGVIVKPTPLKELVVPVWESLKHQREHSGEVLGVPSGIESLDRETTGWREGEMTYVGALPGRGKTSFLLQCMYSAGIAGFGVGCISLEMRSSQLLRRLAILKSGLHAYKFRDSRIMNLAEFQSAKESVFALGELPISICDQSGLKPSQISSLARQMYSEGAKVIFVDFVQIISEEGRERREAINRVSAALRDTCKSLNIPFIVASQLARRDNDPNRRPTIQDLRESGNLEQDAHNVLLLFRPKNKGTGEWTFEDEIIIDKQREGMTGVIPVRYDERSLSYVERI